MLTRILLTAVCALTFCIDEQLFADENDSTLACCGTCEEKPKPCPTTVQG